MQAVDAERLRHVASLFVRLGYGAREAETRAVMVYAYLFGQSLLDPKSVKAADITLAIDALRRRTRAHLSPNQSVAIPRNEKNPTTSVIVVTNGPDDTAGSTPSFVSVSGMTMPPSAAAVSTADHCQSHDHDRDRRH